MGFLAYLLRDKEHLELTSLRVKHSGKHLAGAFAGELERTWAGDGGSGFVGWNQASSKLAWAPYSIRDGEGTAWLHVPSIAGGPESGVGERSLAKKLIDGRVTSEEIGAPFACVKWRQGKLNIVNDMLGLVRLFHFAFDGGDVWATRPGLAHVFMGIEPTKSQIAWDGMATLGWAPAGRSQLGDGLQMRPGSRIEGGFFGGKRHLTKTEDFANWFTSVRQEPEPTAGEMVGDMERYMSTAKRWPREGVADLSGGKDSRVVAAVGLRSGAVKVLRTVQTDHGEVETARDLVAALEMEVEHHVTEPGHAARPQDDFFGRVESQHVAWEGRYLAASGYNSGTFTGFRPPGLPKFNGLGGEVMAGGNLVGSWAGRLAGKPAAAALGKIRANVKLGHAATEEATNNVVASVERYAALGADMGMDSAVGVMDLFYDLDKMPNWSINFGTPNSICPLFAPSVLRYAMHRVGNPLTYGDSHRKILREAIPAWGEIAFYKPTPKRRATPFVWESPDWGAVRSSMLEGLDGSTSFDMGKSRVALQAIEDGDATKRDEIFVHRVIWEITFDSYVARVAREAADARNEYLESASRTVIAKAEFHSERYDRR